MSNNKGGVPISPEMLTAVCSECISNIISYNGEQDKVNIYKRWSWSRFRGVNLEVRESPTWTYDDVGIITRLKQLQSIAEDVMKDSDLVNTDIYLSITTYSELYKLLNKDKSFEPYVFGMGY